MIGFICCLTACKHNFKAQEEKDDKTKTQDFFPIIPFLAGQVHEIDSLKLHVVKYIVVNNRTDSSLITKEEFKTLAGEFMNPDITADSNRKFYKETSFADQSIPSVTITYSTAVKNLEIQRVDVVIKPDPVLTDKVQSLYMEKLSHKNDTSILKKLIWQTGENFQIITSIQVSNQPATFNKLKVSWSYQD